MVPQAGHAVCVGVFVFFCESRVLQFRGVEQVHMVCACVPTASGTLCPASLHTPSGDLPLTPSPVLVRCLTGQCSGAGTGPGVSLVRWAPGGLYSRP